VASSTGVGLLIERIARQLVSDDRNFAELPNASCESGQLLLGINVRICEMPARRRYDGLSDLAGGHVAPPLKEGALRIAPYRIPISKNITILMRANTYRPLRRFILSNAVRTVSFDNKVGKGSYQGYRSPALK
jgi:hypothetical protein